MGAGDLRIRLRRFERLKLIPHRSTQSLICPYSCDLWGDQPNICLLIFERGKARRTLDINTFDSRVFIKLPRDVGGQYDLASVRLFFTLRCQARC